MQLEPSARNFMAEIRLEVLNSEREFTISSEWLEEIHQRCAAIDNETAKLIDHESAMKQLRARLV